MKINEIIRKMSFLQLVPLRSDEGALLAKYRTASAYLLKSKD